MGSTTRDPHTLKAARLATLGSAIVLGVIASLVAVGVASGSRTAVVQLKACAFRTTPEPGVTAAEEVKLAATGGAGMKGTLTVTAAGILRTVHYTLNTKGVVLTSFAIASPGPATLTAKLGRSTRVLHVTLSTSTNPPTQTNCTPTIA